MNRYFGINLEFDQEIIKTIILQCIKNNRKGYVCIVDATVLSMSFSIVDYKEIINNSTVNICDGSSIALLLSKIYKKKYRSYTGSDIFNDYYQMEFRQCFLGNTPIEIQMLKSKLVSDGVKIQKCMFENLPFLDAKDFDYPVIAKKINQFKPDLIWVSLGAPKQEKFINLLYPYLNQGVCLAIGASINFYVGSKLKRAPKWLRDLHLEWLYRFYVEPLKQGKRLRNIMRMYPSIICHELKNNRAIKKKND